MRDITNDQQVAYQNLPEHFSFTDARVAYGRKHQATWDMLRKFISLGYLKETGAGYQKTTVGQVALENGVNKAVQSLGKDAFTPMLDAAEKLGAADLERDILAAV